MNLTTDRDYADLVNPYVRAEREAYERGYSAGILHAAGWLALLLIALCLLP